MHTMPVSGKHSRRPPMPNHSEQPEASSAPYILALTADLDDDVPWTKREREARLLDISAAWQFWHSLPREERLYNNPHI